LAAVVARRSQMYDVNARNDPKTTRYPKAAHDLVETEPRSNAAHSPDTVPARRRHAPPVSICIAVA
jgi:hypothetical protein